MFDVNSPIDVPSTSYKALQYYFRIKTLKAIFQEKFRRDKNRGVDRVSGPQFEKQSLAQIRIIQRKSLKGTYNFSPYLELVRSKGRNKCPRVLSIPTIRDKITLFALKEILSLIFYDCVPRKLATTHVAQIKRSTSHSNLQDFSFLKTDIQNFYGSINRDILFKKLRSRIKSKRLIDLIYKAVTTPTVPNAYHRKDLNRYKLEGSLEVSNSNHSEQCKNLHEISNKYEQIVRECPENHESGDYELFKVQNKQHFQLSFLFESLIRIKLVIANYWLYVTVLLLPFILLYSYSAC